MAGEYERGTTIEAPPAEVFGWVADTGNIPRYLPPIEEAARRGPSEAGYPGEEVSLKGGIPGHYSFEDARGYLSVDGEALRMEWGAELSRDYSGWLSVADDGGGGSLVTVHLSFGPRTVEEQVQEGSDIDRDPMAEAIDATLESIRRQIEEGGGKVEASSLG